MVISAPTIETKMVMVSLLARIYEAQVEGGYEAFMYFIDNLNDLMVETFGDGDRESH